MLIGRIGTVSNDGYTILYDANTETIIEAKVPLLTSGIEIEQNFDGDWYIKKESVPKEISHRLDQAERFYYATRHYLPYHIYTHIVKRFPTNCFTLYQKNPFYLSDITAEGTEVPLVPIPMVDKNICISTFEMRLLEMKYIMHYVLLQNENQGHTWMFYKDFQNHVRYQLAKDNHPLLTGNVSAYLRYYLKEFYFEEEEDLDTSKVAIMSTYMREYHIYRQVLQMIQKPPFFPKYNPTAERDLSTEQNNAVRNLPNAGGGISILTGGPGTGKTTITKTMVTKLQSAYENINIYILCPTGKAARRVKEVFDYMDVNVSTIHKFLGHGHMLTKRELTKIQNADVILIDEASMIDLELFEKLLNLLNINRTKLMLIGDVNQLPSIGAGNVLSDLIQLGVYTEYLTENYRSQGSIVKNAIAINNGDIFLDIDDTFQILYLPPDLISYLASIIAREDDIIITPYKTPTQLASTTEINKLIQEKRFDTPTYDGYHVGDYIIINKTNYKLGYYNGETGVILSKLPSGDFYIGLGDRNVTVKNPKEMSLGYAITAHKSQGSQYPSPIICIPDANDFITRKVLYTAITRAEGEVKILVPNMETLIQVILNNPEESRRTFLALFSKY